MDAFDVFKLCVISCVFTTGLGVLITYLLTKIDPTTREARLLKAVKFYARKYNYETAVMLNGVRYKSNVEHDGGNIARIALSEYTTDLEYETPVI